MKFWKKYPLLWNLCLFALLVFFAFSMRTWHYNTSVEILRDLGGNDRVTKITLPTH